MSWCGEGRARVTDPQLLTAVCQGDPAGDSQGGEGGASGSQPLHPIPNITREEQDLEEGTGV